MDPLEQVIREIHTELERRCARAVSPGFEARDRHQMKKPPWILYEEQGGVDEEPNATKADTLLFDVSKLRVTVWGENEEQCRLIMWNLKQAGRTAWGRDVHWIDRSPPVDAKESGFLTCGKMIVLNARLYLRVRKSAYRLPSGAEPPSDFVSRPVTNDALVVNLNDQEEP